MSVTSNSLEQLIAPGGVGAPFLQRVEFNLTLAAEQIASEAGSTPLHAQRARYAAQVLANPSSYVANAAQDIIAQLPLSSTNLIAVGGVANADVDTTDASLLSTIAGLWNDWLAT